MNVPWIFGMTKALKADSLCDDSGDQDLVTSMPCVTPSCL